MATVYKNNIPDMEVTIMNIKKNLVKSMADYGRMLHVIGNL